MHCRATAGEPPADELTTDQLLDVADQLVGCGTRLVVLTGGEPTLHPGWRETARRLADGGVRVRLFTHGHWIDDESLRAAEDAGVTELAISIDGPPAIHDRLRPPERIDDESPFAAARRGVAIALKQGIGLRVATQVNRLNVDHLGEIYRIVRDLGVKHWQVHLCQATGRALNHRAELLCEPDDLEKIIRVLLLAAKERALNAPLHCTVGYMTAEEPVLRGRELKGGRPVWLGCEAGRRTIAIDSTGGVKGCTTLADEFVTASLLERSLADIWNDDSCFPYTRAWDRDVLTGACARCPLADTCRAGCPAVAYGATGSIGLNPYCLHQVRERQ
jgi:radical SAM protein with 4Fe4S-binding SPASM domain